MAGWQILQLWSSVTWQRVHCSRFYSAICMLVYTLLTIKIQKNSEIRRGKKCVFWRGMFYLGVGTLNLSSPFLVLLEMSHLVASLACASFNFLYLYLSKYFSFLIWLFKWFFELLPGSSGTVKVSGVHISSALSDPSLVGSDYIFPYGIWPKTVPRGSSVIYRDSKITCGDSRERMSLNVKFGLGKLLWLT